jgi:heterodisulfide reductase subunit C
METIPKDIRNIILFKLEMKDKLSLVYAIPKFFRDTTDSLRKNWLLCLYWKVEILQLYPGFQYRKCPKCFSTCMEFNEAHDNFEFKQTLRKNEHTNKDIKIYEVGFVRCTLCNIICVIDIYSQPIVFAYDEEALKRFHNKPLMKEETFKHPYDSDEEDSLDISDYFPIHDSKLYQQEVKEVKEVEEHKKGLELEEELEESEESPEQLEQLEQKEYWKEYNKVKLFKVGLVEIIEVVDNCSIRNHFEYTDSKKVSLDITHFIAEKRLSAEEISSFLRKLSRINDRYEISLASRRHYDRENWLENLFAFMNKHIIYLKNPSKKLLKYISFPKTLILRDNQRWDERMFNLGYTLVNSYLSEINKNLQEHTLGHTLDEPAMAITIPENGTLLKCKSPLNQNIFYFSTNLDIPEVFKEPKERKRR